MFSEENAGLLVRKYSLIGDFHLRVSLVVVVYVTGCRIALRITPAMLDSLRVFYLALSIAIFMLFAIIPPAKAHECMKKARSRDIGKLREDSSLLKKAPENMKGDELVKAVAR